jgi:hypothetical protein
MASLPGLARALITVHRYTGLERAVEYPLQCPRTALVSTDGVMS